MQCNRFRDVNKPLLELQAWPQQKHASWIRQWSYLVDSGHTYNVCDVAELLSIDIPTGNIAAIKVFLFQEEVRHLRNNEKIKEEYKHDHSQPSPVIDCKLDAVKREGGYRKGHRSINRAIVTKID